MNIPDWNLKICHEYIILMVYQVVIALIAW